MRCCWCLHIINHPGLSTQYLLLVSQPLRTNPTLDSADFRGHRPTHLEKVYPRVSRAIKYNRRIRTNSGALRSPLHAMRGEQDQKQKTCSPQTLAGLRLCLDKKECTAVTGKKDTEKKRRSSRHTTKSGKRKKGFVEVRMDDVTKASPSTGWVNVPNQDTNMLLPSNNCG